MITRLLYLFLLAIGLVVLTESASILLKHGVLGRLLGTPVILADLIVFLFFWGHSSDFFKAALTAMRHGTSAEKESQKLCAQNVQEWIKIRTNYYGIAYQGNLVLIGPPEIRQRLKVLLNRYDTIPQYNRIIKIAYQNTEGFLYEPFSYVRKKVDYGWVAFDRKNLEFWESRPEFIMWHLLFSVVRARLRRRGVVITRWNQKIINERIGTFLVKRYRRSLETTEEV